MDSQLIPSFCLPQRRAMSFGDLPDLSVPDALPHIILQSDVIRMGRVDGATHYGRAPSSEELLNLRSCAFVLPVGEFEAVIGVDLLSGNGVQDVAPEVTGPRRDVNLGPPARRVRALDGE